MIDYQLDFFNDYTETDHLKQGILGLEAEIAALKKSLRKDFSTLQRFCLELHNRVSALEARKP